MIAFLVVLVVVGLFAARRRRRTMLAGLNSAKPSFTVSPPTRWSTTGRDHRL